MVGPEEAGARGMAGAGADADEIRQREILLAQLARHDRSQAGERHTAGPFLVAGVQVIGGQLVVRLDRAHAAQHGGVLHQPRELRKVLADLNARNRRVDRPKFAADAGPRLRA